jgi:hypothetical protein
VPGRVPDCYLGLLLDPPDHDTQAAGVLVVAPAVLLHPHVPQPDGTVLSELVTGHPNRPAHELVFSPTSRSSCAPGPPAPGRGSASTRRQPPAPIIAAWRAATSRADTRGGLTVEEALALERPAMTSMRASSASGLPARLARRTGAGCTPPADAG